MSAAPSTPTAPVTLASTSGASVSASVSSSAPVSGDAAVTQLIQLNAGLDKVNITLQAILLGQGVLNDINSGIQKGMTTQAVAAPGKESAPDFRSISTEQSQSGSGLRSARTMAEVPLSISVNRANAAAI